MIRPHSTVKARMSGSNTDLHCFFGTAQQAQLALVAKQRLDASGQLGKPVATVIVPLGEFQLADEDQQRYLEKHGASSCSI